MILNKNRFLSILLALVMAFSVFPFAVAADEKTVFVSASKGSDSAEGSENLPFKTIDRALRELKDGGTLVLTDRYEFKDPTVTVSDVPVYNAPKYDGNVTVTSVYGGKDWRQSGAELVFTQKTALSLGGNTVFDKITVSSAGEEVYFIANFKELSFGGGFVSVNSSGTDKFLYAVGGYFAPQDMNMNAKLDPHITVNGGSFKRIIGFSMYTGKGTYTFSGTSYITVNGGEIDRVYGASVVNHYSGSLEFVMTGGNIGEINSGGDASRRLNGSALVFIGGGTVGTLNVNNVVGNAAIVLDGGRITGKCSVISANEEISYLSQFSIKRVCYNSDEFTEAFAKGFSGAKEYVGYKDYKSLDISDILPYAKLSDISVPEEIIEPQTVFVSSYKGKDTNEGTENAPFKTLTKAIDFIKYSGGYIVITDKYTMGEGMVTVDGIPWYTAPASFRPIIITSVYGGKDYRAIGAALHFPQKSAYLLGGATEFADVVITSDASDVYIAGCFNDLTFGEGFTAKHAKGGGRFLYAIGGYFAPDKNSYPDDLDSHVTINGGSFKKVIGFTHVKGMTTYTFTGTSYITVNGGQIEQLYGASNYNHYSGSTVIEVNGGQIGELCAAGDATRRLDGSADITLNGGSISAVTLNNTIGDTNLVLNNAKVVNITNSYASDAIKELATGSKIKLSYNSVVYSADWVSRFYFFTDVSTFGTVYVKTGANGDGKSEETPTGSLKKAMEVIADGGGYVIIMGEFTAPGFSEPKHSGAIVIKGGENGKLTINGAYELSGATTFESLKMDGTCDFYAGGNKVTFGKGLEVSGEFNVFGGRRSSALKNGAKGEVVIESGTFNEVCGIGGGDSSVTYKSANVSVTGGKVNTLCGATRGDGITENVTIAITGGEVSKIITVGNGGKVNAASIDISGGSVSNVEFARVNGTSVLRYNGGFIGDVSLNSVNGDKLFKYDSEKTDAKTVDKLKAVFGNGTVERVIFVRDGGKGNGSSAALAAGSLAEAFTTLGDGGGYVVIVGTVTVSDILDLPKSKGSFTLTSVYDGIDYAKSAGAKLIIGANVAFNCDITLEKLTVESTADGVAFVFNGYDAVIGEGVECTRLPSVSVYVDLIAGSDGNDGYGSDLTVNSGKWNSVTGGNTARAKHNGVKFNTVINGGEFHGHVVAAGRGDQQGSASLTVNGGTLFAGAFGTNAAAAGEGFTGNINFTLNGGTFYCKVALGTSRLCTVNGKFNLALNGGDYVHLTDIDGDELFNGDTVSTITVSESFDISKAISGKLTYTNPIDRAADPRAILVDGMYYYVYTTGSALAVYKAANLPDLGYSAPERVWNAKDPAVSAALEGRDENIWPTELQYFSAEDFGAEYEGYYHLFSTYKPSVSDSGYVDGENRRSYLLKSATNDLQGAWINPETGEENIPVRLVHDSDPNVNFAEWTAGQSVFRYNGKVYSLWVEQRGRGTDDFKQIARLAEMKNPWTLTGPILDLIIPELTREREGYGYSSAQGIWYPAVIEGLTPMVTDNNELFVVYASSGYWTPGYNLGQMTFKGGDLFDINNWVKKPESIFKKNSELCGVGGPNLVTSPDGQTKYLLYHAYFGSDTSGYRYCFMEPYTLDSEGFHVGQNYSPSPLITSFEVDINSTPVYKKIGGFDNWDGNFLYVEEGYTVRKADADKLDIKLFGGSSYDKSCGDISYSYSVNGTDFTDGLPSADGTYTVKAVLSGNYAYNGLGGVFTLTVDKNAPENPIGGDIGGDITSDGNSVVLIICICTAGLLFGAAVLIILRKRKVK